MMNLTNTTQKPLRIYPQDHDANHTVTFIIGFSILLIFILIGLLASTFLCYILEKDIYLWETEQKKLDEENEMKEDDSEGIKVEVNITESNCAVYNENVESENQSVKI
ncbi:hypothetical protein HHI36_015519 [Cryptolaemus montrouzieri]|uniref:Uncharacterized protein n=1 Tax=Cryptolaemus montrouzieri TaxID=559131 RepID=A0ABD2N628_9CUCU